MSKSLIYDLMDKITKLKKVFDSHRSAKPLDHPDKSITPPKIDYINEPSEGLTLAYDSSTGRFKWIAGAGMSVHDKVYHQSPVLPDNDVHRTSIPIDHPDRSVTRDKLEYPTVDVSFDYLMSIDKLTFSKTMVRWWLTTVDSFSDRAVEALFAVVGRDGIVARFINTSNFYNLSIDIYASARDFFLEKVVNDVSTILAYESVNLTDRNVHLIKGSFSGSTLKGYREDMATPKFTVTDTALASGGFGIREWETNLSSYFPNYRWIYLRSPSSVTPQPIAYFEIPIIGSGTPEDPFRPQMPEEISWDWSLNPSIKRKYDILKSKGFTDEEIIELFPEVLSCRTNRFALTNSALIVSDSVTGKPREYTTIVRIFDQPDRQQHMYPMSRCIEELKRMKGVKELKRDLAIKRAKQLDEKLHDLDLVSIRELGVEKKKAVKEYKDWLLRQSNVEMEDDVAAQYVEEDKGW